MIRMTNFAVVCLVGVLAVKGAKIDVGYPVGFLPNCPGILKPAVIKPETLKKSIYMSVMGSGSVFFASWTRYYYHGIEELMKHPDIDLSKKTFFYVGGYLDFTALPIGRGFGEIYRKMGYNAIMLDYLSLSANDYVISSRLIRPVAKHAAEMLVKLTNLGLDPKKLELVGLSLGGHTMSAIAKNYRDVTGRNISKLIALDPAGACFRHLGPEHRLDASDADFVVNIITNSEGYGMATPLGHVNFYVNGGEHQVGNIATLPCTLECSHLKVIPLWLAAMTYPNSFIGIQCDSVQQARDAECYDRKPMVTNTMDLYTDRNKPGIFYVPALGNYPYAVGKKGLMKNRQ